MSQGRSLWAGYIMLTRSVDDIKAEARNLALRNKSLGRTVLRSYGCQVEILHVMWKA